MTVRTRVAPSPTGDPHVGTAYVALFNYCYAKKHGGEFILRIEDTDQARSTRESEEKILDALRWIGLEWDEGPDKGGKHGPYRQSERTEIYSQHAKILLDGGHAYRCFLTTEQLNARRAEARVNKTQITYDVLSTEEQATRAAAGEPHVLRLKVPDEGVCVVQDELRGTIEIEWAQVDDQVLLKSDGMPTYHLANVVDDHLMGITHVLRGEEWISSAPKHLLLYKAFGWTPPVLCHLPLLRNPDKSKLSKRKNPTSILFYERMGYLPEGLLNYLGRMAFSMPNAEEKFTLEEMVEAFGFNRISLGGPVFDKEKLNWLNGRWLREDLSEDQYVERLKAWSMNEDFLRQIVPLIQGRVERFSDIAPLAGHFLHGLMDVKKEQFNFKKVDEAQMKRVFQWNLWRLEAMPAWTRDGIEAALRGSADLLEMKLRDVLAPFFVTLSGQPSSTPLFDTMAVLGKDITLGRIRDGLNALGGISKKQLGREEKAYQAAIKTLEAAALPEG